jgi:hypothetical protein
MTETVGEITFPVSQKLSINYSAYEDRLIVRAQRLQNTPVTLLLTRRMTFVILQQVLARLADMSELGKTPSEYWQDVLQMSHQQAMTAKAEADKAAAEQALAGNPADATAQGDGPVAADQLFLATELTIQMRDKQLMLAFKGLAMPDAMTLPRPHVPVLAIPLLVDNVHQLLELLISRAQQADWHLPVNLPWMANKEVPHAVTMRRDN